MNFLSYVSIVFSVTLLNNLLFVQSAISPVYPSTCITCASESLLSKWSATSLPAPPSSFDTAKFFTSDCDSVDIQNVLTLKSVKCDSPCFATTIYTVGAINVVRGCMDDFFPDESISEAKSQITKVGEATNAQYCSMDIAAETHLEDQYAVNYCVTITPAGAAEPLACNAKPAVTKSGTVIDLTCTQANGDAKDIDCYKCSNQNGNGECAASDSSKCKGKFCTKTSGTIGGKLV
uniref:DUF281 domain-containing protein n=1 Tax=Rhabditophanes sp. KR3021 TaxID=114890 RepID=A0AC35U5H2_9BILA